ncbi:hypothetical protein HPB50_023665 [Hyalomma asiaticum]|uniref:Uncharacterized protein n=1 Tax=Hyalomma asiaticum TaxID=266040 RepID=A0ACB7TAG3_HYAAI|nr:hypothetical protein HPB50_023665 [Hyalomma asiaticum]
MARRREPQKVYRAFLLAFNVLLMVMAGSIASVGLFAFSERRRPGPRASYMAKRTKRHRSEESLVQCDRCDRWLHLDETGFQDIEAASAASPFTCKPCVTVESLHARLRTAESDVASMHERQRKTEADMEVLRALVEQLQARLPMSMIPPEKESMDPNGQPVASGPELMHTTHPEGECGLSREKNAAETTQPVEEVTANEKRQHERTRTSDTHETEAEATTNHSVERGANGTKDRDSAAAQSQKAVQEPENDTIANPTREILVCGDKSIARIAAAMRYQLSGRAVRHSVFSNATAIGLRKRADRLVIFHAGAKDAVSDAQSTEALRVIRDLVIPSSPDLIVCSTTEVAERGKETGARAALLNVQMKELCDKSGATFLDLSKVTKANGGVESDGQYLSSEASYCVATQVVKLAQPFLGGRKQLKRDKRYSAGRHRTEPTISHALQGKPQTQLQQLTDEVSSQSTQYARAPNIEERLTPESTSARPLELHRPQHLPDRPDVMASPPPICHPVHRGGVLASRPPGPSSVPLTWGPHLGTAHPTMTPWQTLSPSFAVATPDVAVANPPMIPKLHRRHHRRRITTNVNVGFLNLHGARKAAKWAELYATLNMENISLYGVAETHLRELEEPPVDPEWQWAGCNRTGDCRKGGGVGVLWRNNAAWVPMKGPRDEHIWVTGSILGESVLFGVVYLTVASGPNDGNDKVLQCIVEDVKRWGADREVLLMGDFNGHIPATDGYLDYNGKLLLRCAEQLSLEIVNLRTDCEGCFTWCARSSCSTIDYALATAKLAARIAQVHIDEDGQFSLGSDHNRIRLSFSRGGSRTGRRSPPPRRGMYLPSKSVDRVAEDFENCPQRRKSHSYSEFVCALDAVMRTRMVQERRPGHRPQNSWWDREVHGSGVERTPPCESGTSEDRQRSRH